jgi:signal transduction histidine kinase
MTPTTSRVRSTLTDDFVLALVVAALLVVGTGVSLQDDFEISLTGGGPWPSLPPSEAILLLVVGALPLTFRRVAPITVFVLTAASSLAYQSLGFQAELLPLGVLVALYTIAVVRSPLICMVAAVIYVVIFTTASLSGWAPLTDDQFYIDLVSVIATVMLGYGVALGHARATLAEQSAAELAREQESRTQAAVAQEQARIAREVHDIVAHDLSVMVAQAGAARRVVTSKPGTAAAALSSIEVVGRDALDGLRRLVTLLRTEMELTERSPQPGLDRLPWLLAQVQRAGLPVELSIRGTPRLLSATVELNAFRIVQEALTNVLKHAGRTRATVVLDYQDDHLRVEIRDHGRGSAASPSAGYGLISMQQRAAMLGGELVARPLPHGFVVSARLPIPDSDRRPVHEPVGQWVQPQPRRPVVDGVR